jgi:Anti-anti-sigma regulatory factor (antagonist of anti-sigma factor)
MISVIGGTNVLKMEDIGEDYEYASVMDGILEQIKSPQPSIVVDLQGIDHLNSMGINFLLRLRKRSNEVGGQMAIAAATGRVRSVLNATQLYELFNPYDTIDDAVNQM